jgi:hypothetical protein
VRPSIADAEIAGHPLDLTPGTTPLIVDLEAAFRPDRAFMPLNFPRGRICATDTRQKSQNP